MIMEEASFRSAALGRDMPYRVILPGDYKQSKRRYASLYLLHPINAHYNVWSTAKIDGWARGRGMIVVLPEGEDSWFTNSASVPGDRFEDYIGHDLIAEIDHRYRTIPAGRARAIAGLSMGGYGAVKIALKNPRDFVFAGSISGAFDAPTEPQNYAAAFADKLDRVFGPPGSPSRAENDVFVRLEKANPKDLPYFFIACGTADGLITINQKFAEQLRSRGVRHEYHEAPGGHDLKLWYRELPSLFRAASRLLQPHTK
jgi:putative tributyrin esterase